MARTVLVTGANRGIGRQLAADYAALGDRVIGTARGEPPGDMDAGISWERLDVTDRESLCALAGRDLPVIDILIANAGVYHDKGQSLADGFPAAMWAGTFATNVTGVFLTVQALLPRLRTPGARIAIIASMMGSSSRAPGGSYIYRASKAAAVNLSRNLAADLAPRGIAVGAWHPGWVRTDMGGAGADIDPAEAAAGLIARIDALNPESAGVFEDWQGNPIPF